MTRRTSLRAQAQRLFVERQQAENPNASRDEMTLTSDPPSPIGSGGQADLTARVRALYEGSAVPVREIARVAGVTERTIYKYARKHGWKPRYRWTPGGERPLARRPSQGLVRGSGWRADDALAPAKGAGGRFIARAAAECVQAQRLAAAAEKKAAVDHARTTSLRAFGAVNRALGKLADYREERARQHRERVREEARRLGPQSYQPPKPPDWSNDETERGLELSLRAAIDWLKAVQIDERKLLDAMGEDG